MRTFFTFISLTLTLIGSVNAAEKNNEKVNEFNDIWWSEVNNFSARDQLSQVYSSWKTDIKIAPIPIGSSIYINKYLNPKIKHPKKWLI